MRKILSILIALGLVLGLSVMAVAPTAGATCASTVALSPATACAGATTTYTITTTPGVTLLPVNDKLSVEFGAGTTFGFLSVADIQVDAQPIDSLLDVVVTGTKVVFPIPSTHAVITPATSIIITIAKVKNPAVAVPTKFTMNLDYDLACCAGVVFDCAEYTINPKYSRYDFVWDSSPTYPGIAVNFTPPFKACGQEDFAGFNIGAMPGGKFLNLFDLLLKPMLVGCAGPCPAGNVTVTLNLTSAPAGANVTLSLNSTTYDPTKIIDLTPTTKKPQPQIVIGEFALGANETWNWSNAIHFSTVGDYQICLKAICPADYTCPTCSLTPTVIADECFTIKVYQWKTAEKINLFRKWNLISLPLVPLAAGQPIADVLKALPNWDTLIKGIYYYDCAAKAWKAWGSGQTSLSTLEDGKSYWVKVDYVLGSATKGPGLPVGGLWVWGTPKPVPPSAPSAYPVCAGWNMVGLTGYDLIGFLPATTQGAYLWNWWAPGPTALYGAIFGWTPTTQAWWSVLPSQAGVLPQLQTGEGYWISFAANGMIYPP